MPRKRTRGENWKDVVRYELYGLGLILLSLIALSETWGAVGRSLRYILRFVAGNWDFLIPLALIALGLYVLVKRKWPRTFSPRMAGALLLFLAILIFSHIRLFSQLTNEGQFEISIVKQTFNLILEESHGPKQPIGGGLLGAFLFMVFYYLFGNYGTFLVASFMTVTAVMLLTGITFEKIANFLKRGLLWFHRRLSFHFRQLAILLKAVERRERGGKGNGAEKEDEDSARVILSGRDAEEDPDAGEADRRQPVIHDFKERALDPSRKSERESRTVQAEIQSAGMAEEEGILGEEAPEDPPDYKLPSFSLLDKPRKGSARDYRDIASNAQKLEQTLKSFGVHAKVTDIHRGPAVTRYEIQPDTGVKVSRIVSLTDDLALALAARDIRIEAPIPGKSAIGIEVPNPQVSIVTLREVLESSSFTESPSKLTLALGRDISGEPIVGDLAGMPHLLVAGATGSGKSVCINAMIASILYKAKPNEVKFLMIDPKMVELTVYNGIPHLLAPVVTDPRKASIALRKAVAEMEKRYELFSQLGAKDIERYNQLVLERRGGLHKPLPYIVVIVDELADLMMVSPADVEDSITRLAQKARAAGIHLILATQRPSVDVITGVIKANIPSRIAFAVSSQVDSRTILDMAGAEKLLGKGDMLYLPVGSSKVTRIQGCFVSDREIERLVSAIKAQQEARYAEELLPENLPEDEGVQAEDELYERAVQLVIESQTASVSLLQRRFRIGYARAARLIDMMEQNGIVGPYEGSKPREVLVKKREDNIS